MVVDLAIEIDLSVGLLALAVAAYGLTAATLSRRSVSAPFAFMVIGAAIGGVGIGIILRETPDPDVLGFLAELTLAIVLFGAASTIRLRRLEMDSPIVLRLLAVGLPLTIALGTVLALGLFPGISLGVALLMGAILAPTDADLGHQVITDRSVPARVRRLLNVESGLNDGIAAPVVSIGILLATAGDLGGAWVLADALRDLGVAAGVGLLVGGAGHWLIKRADEHQTATTGSRQIATLALAIGAYAIAAGLDSSGFIAAFVAGLAFGLGDKSRVASAISFTEAQSTLLSIVVWLVFGLVVIGEDVFGLRDPMVIVYAVLALTLLRMLPVALALVGTGFDRVTVGFMGWFGPRGLASVVFVILAIGSLDAAGVASDPLGPVVAWTVTLSVILHGFSATGLARRYGRYAASLPMDRPEHLGEQEPRRPSWSIHTAHDGST